MTERRGLEHWVRLGRPVDPGVPTNRAIAIAAALAFAAVATWRFVEADAPADGVVAALATFLAWALGREVDPDHDHSAFLAAALGFALAVSPTEHAIDVAASFWMLLTLRVANRSTGQSAGPIDTLLVLGLTAWGATHGYPIVGVIAALAFVLDATLRDPVRGRHVAAAAVAVGLAIVGWTTTASDSATDDPLPPFALGLVVGAALGFSARAIVSGPPRSLGDRDGRPLDARRVLGARLLAALSCVAFAWTAGWSGLVALGTTAAAIVAAAIWPSRRAA